MKIFKCKICDFKIHIHAYEKNLAISAKHSMGAHYGTEHKDIIPPGMTGFQYFYFLLTGKSRGSCVICKSETDFNEKTMKYSRFCNNTECKKTYKTERDNRMLKARGTVYVTKDPEFQKKMLANRKISGIYEWSDGTKLEYTGSYERHFLEYLDKSLQWTSSDIMSPSPHIYSYEYNDTSHYYIPDFFIPTLSLEIEIKDDGSAKNINDDSRAKDVIKNELMNSCSNLFNYIKIVNKDYSKFMELIKEDD